MGTMSEQITVQDCRMEAPGRAPSGMGRRPGLGAEGRALLTAAVQGQVIPRLVAMPWAGRGRLEAFGEAAVAACVALCLSEDPLGVARHVAGLCRSGVSAEAIYDGLLTASARRLGVMWENDDCNFADVTIGLLRLQNAQRALSPEFVAGKVAGVGAPRAVLFPVPGEQHSFGLSIVLDHFRRAGWEGCLAQPETPERAAAVAAGADLVGISLACDEHVPVAAAVVTAVRASGRDVVVMVGGPLALLTPGLTESIGADASAADGQEAVLRANALLHRAAGYA